MAGAADDIRSPRLFLGYAAADEEWVEGFLLPELGIASDMVSTIASLSPGLPRPAAIEQVVSAASTAVLVLSEAFLADEWTLFGEHLANYMGAVGAMERLIPIRLDECTVPPRLGFRVWLDCRSPEHWGMAVSRLRAALGRPAPAAQAPVACPYPGMVPFDVGDSEFFFGRGGEVDDLYRRLRAHNFLVVIGPSGSGKSSLVMAGLVPRLATAYGTRLRVAVVKPGERPPQALAEALNCGEVPVSAELAREAVANELGRHPPADRLLLVIDQFEEVFTSADAADRSTFLAAVRALKDVSACLLVLTLRADFYGDLMHTELWPRADVERVDILPLRGRSLRDAVARPANAVGVHLEPALVERLVHDSAGGPGVLPLLQETLVQLWERRRRRLLTLDAYEKLGGEHGSGVAQAIASHARGTLAGFSPKEQAVARRVLVRLVQFGADGDSGDGVEDTRYTRRRVSQADLCGAGQDRAVVDEVVRRLAASRIVTLDHSRSLATVDLAHEALIEHWPELQEWIKQDRGSEVLRRRIEADSAEWRDHGRDRGALYRGSPLAEASAWRSGHPGELGDEAEAFLRAAGRRKLHVRALSVATTVVVLAFASWFGARAVEARRDAAEQASLKNEALAAGPVVFLPAGLAAVRPGEPPVRVGDLYVEVHEVTNRQYQLCLRAGKCTSVALAADTGSGEKADLPVVNVNAYEAAQYCRWVGRRLPTVDEWLRAARGLEGRRYPWGSYPSPTPDRVNAEFETAHLTELAEVDDEKFRGGSTREGITHLLGNANEWTATIVRYEGEEAVVADAWDMSGQVELLVVMGGAYTHPVPSVEEWLPAVSHQANSGIGFRCVAGAD